MEHADNAHLGPEVAEEDLAAVDGAQLRLQRAVCCARHAAVCSMQFWATDFGCGSLKSTEDLKAAFDRETVLHLL